MGDYYTEQLVKRNAPASTILAKAALILLTVASVGLVLIIPVAIIAPIILICLDVFLFRSMDVEFEYLFVNGALDIDKIMAKSRRKKVFTMELNEMEVLAQGGSAELRPYQGLKTVDFSSGNRDAKQYEMVIVQKGEKKRVVFEPNSTILEGMKMLAPRKVFV